MESFIVLDDRNDISISTSDLGSLTTVNQTEKADDIEVLVNSYCGKPFCIVRGTLYMGQLGDRELSWSTTHRVCTSCSIGRSVMCYRDRSRNKYFMANFDPSHVLESISQNENGTSLPSLSNKESLGASFILVSPRDHVLVVTSAGNVYLLRGDPTNLSWAHIATPPQKEGKRGLLGRAKSFLRSLTEGSHRVTSASLGHDCVWVVCTRSDVMYKLPLGDVDSANIPMRQWVTYQMPKESHQLRQTVQSLREEDSFLGLSEDGSLFSFKINSEEMACEISSVVSPQTGDLGGGPALLYQCIGIVYSLPRGESPGTASVSGDEDEDFMEPSGFSELGAAKYQYRYCCEKGDCESCKSMEFSSVLLSQPSGSTSQMLINGLSVISGQKRLPGSEITHTRKRFRSNPGMNVVCHYILVYSVFYCPLLANHKCLIGVDIAVKNSPTISKIKTVNYFCS